MALQHTSAIVTNGLAFAYDMNSIRSYKGPTIQNIANVISVIGGTGTGYSSTASTEVVTLPGLGPITSYVNTIQNNYTSYTPNSNNCCPSLHSWGGITVTPSTQYTYLILYRCNTGYTNPNYMYRYEYTSNGGTYVTEGGVHSNSNRVSLGDGWYYAWGTFTTQATTTWLSHCGTFYYRYSNTADRLSVAKVAIIPGNYAGLHPKYWPNPVSTRSNTQAIVDLTNTNTITANSLTYNSDGTFSFSGSDYATVGALSGSFSSFTVSVWFNSSAVENYRNPIDCNYSTYTGVTGNVGPRLEQNSSGNLMWVTSGNTTNNSVFDAFTVKSSGLSANTWYNAVLTWTNGSASTYLNGNIVTSGAATPNGFVGTFGSVVIGKGYGIATDRSFKGQVGSVNIYNRALTAAEVQQNFNALKGRYGV
jgi:Concanavalin A-like lectin/glucanases superfamily